MAMNPRLLRPLASGRFSPASISGLEAWYDASVASSITLTGGFVSQWSDIGPNGLHVTQSTEANRPSTGTVNGRGCIVFDGSNDYLQSATYTGTVHTVICAHRVASTANGGIYHFGRAGSIASMRAMSLLAVSSGTEYRSRGTNGDVTPTVVAEKSGGTLTVNQTRIFRQTFDGTANLAAIDGSLISGTTGVTQSADAVIIFGSRVISGVYSLPLNGSICETIAYNRALSESEIAKVEGYLAWKWGLQANLPYDHPYAKSFPGYGSQTTPTDSDALTYLAAVKAADGTGMEVSVANAINDFITGCKSDGIWDAIKASCILAGARTLAGALVPLKTPYGPEKWDSSVTPDITNFGGSTGAWDAATLTASSSGVGSNDTFPRFRFNLGLTVGKRYRITGRIVPSHPGTAGSLKYLRLGSGALLTSLNRNTGEFDEVATCLTDGNFGIDLNGTIDGASATIEELTIREDTFTPQNYNFVSGDYDRATGLVGNGSTKSLSTNRANNADPQDNHHFAAWLTSAPTAGSIIGAGGGASGTTRMTFSTATTRNYLSRSNSTSSHTATDAAGFWGMSRSSSGEFTSRASSSNQLNAVASQTPSSSSISVFNSTGLSAFSNGRIAYYSMGESLDLALLDTRVSALITAIGAAIP